MAIVEFGKDEEKAGLKYDDGKIRMDLIPWNSIDEVMKVMTFGANKYTPGGWKTVPDGLARYEAALIRHLSAYKQGEEIDKESGLPHLAHMACNALFMLSYYKDKSCSAHYAEEKKVDTN